MRQSKGRERRLETEQNKYVHFSDLTNSGVYKAGVSRGGN